jgi:hypothetical protein
MALYSREVDVRRRRRNGALVIMLQREALELYAAVEKKNPYHTRVLSFQGWIAVWKGWARDVYNLRKVLDPMGTETDINTMLHSVDISLNPDCVCYENVSHTVHDDTSGRKCIRWI